MSAHATIRAVASTPNHRPVVRLLISVGATLVGITVVGGVILALLEGSEKAGRRLGEIDVGWLALSLAIWSASAVLQALRWRALLPVARRPPPGMLTWIVLGANALTLAVPGPVGEFASAWYLRHRYGVPMVTALAATLLGRALAILCFGIATLTLWPLRAAALPPDVVQLVTPIALVTGGITLPIAWLCFRPGHAVAFVGGMLNRVLRGERAVRVRERVAWWTQCFAALGSIGASRWATAVGLCFLNLGVMSVSTLTSLRAVGIVADPLGTVFMQSITAVASVAGILVPGGFGAVEVLVVAIFPTFASGTTADAVFAAVALRSIHLLTLLLGLPAMLWLIATLPAEAEAMEPLMSETMRGELS